MTDLYKQLVTDHQNMSLILTILSTETSHYTDATLPQADIPLIVEIFKYIRDYPDLFHHPIEEVIFDFLLYQQAVDPMLINEIRKQHKKMATITRELQLSFLHLLTDGSSPTYALTDKLQEFISMLKEHMAIENNKIFPLMTKLNDGDWWDIASCMVIRRDPLFEDGLCEDLHQLAKRIKSKSSDNTLLKK